MKERVSKKFTNIWKFKNIIMNNPLMGQRGRNKKNFFKFCVR